MHEYWMVSKKRFEQMEVQSEVSSWTRVSVAAIFRSAITATGNGTVAIARYLGEEEGKIDAR